MAEATRNVLMIEDGKNKKMSFKRAGLHVYRLRKVLVYIGFWSHDVRAMRDILIRVGWPASPFLDSVILEIQP